MTSTTTINTLVDQLKANPLNWALLAVFLYVLRSYISAPANAAPEPRHPETIVFKDYTPIELQPYTGKQDNGMGRILMAVNGNVYDVSRGRNFYGPDGPYGNFGGRDASRGLAKGSFDLDMLTDVDKPIDKLEDLARDEWEALREWEAHFAGKYLLVGKLVENI
ncbi:cytochrome b5-like heme/steroid binding domain-containing protein [Jimgerdemannia flammicorona]|uniref:Cytochrome b5-like heme/steroid binding domain-containing protein n=2 Tax=Jimgerdemannia flammicorona TaxID=994334 RepID=A0A433PDS9_9FUNG|nr:cytochrome b5-like heme/steroid binding domain-containing protein [Jimgerdemannia flammicorona]RUS15687.1 cytochrome b5-like heme/steroid binding domain-containing protein [Jimgerdemannia flammicorona]